VAVAVDAARPHGGLVLPHLSVVVESHGQVVGDEVLGRHAQVHRVPVLELQVGVVLCNNVSKLREGNA